MRIQDLFDSTKSTVKEAVDPTFKMFKGGARGKVKDVLKMSGAEIEALDDDKEPVWVHVAAALLGATNLSQLRFCDNETASDQEIESINFVTKKKLKPFEYGYNAIEVGTINGVKAVMVSDHGYLAYAILKQ